MDKNNNKERLVHENDNYQVVFLSEEDRVRFNAYPDGGVNYKYWL